MFAPIQVFNSNIKTIYDFKPNEHCCDDPMYINGYVSNALFTAKYCQQCNTITLNERQWINKTWLLLCKPFWLRKKLFYPTFGSWI